MRTSKNSSPLSVIYPLSTIRDGFELVATYPADTMMAQVGTGWTSDFRRAMQHDGQRWILKSLEKGIARFWSPDLKVAA